jgi:arsenite-transporting ATPase
MLDRLGDELFGDRLPAEVMHTELTQEISSENGITTLRLRVPFGERDDLKLKQVGTELVVSVGRQKRTIILPAALARRRPAAAKLADGALEIRFESPADRDDARSRPTPAVR